jgi:ADP-heptose:LPS heptosyltransferase
MVTAPSLTTLLLMLASGARHRLGIAGRGGGVDSVLTLPVAPLPGDGHLVEHLARLAIPFGVDPARADLRSDVPLTAEERAWAESTWGARTGATRLLVNVSAGTAARQWPEARFVETLRAVGDHPPALDVVVIGAPAERGRAERIAAATGARYVATRSVREALALVAGSDAVLTPDTSISHAAAAFGRPIVVLLVRGQSPRWTPYRTEARPVEWRESTLDDLPAAPVIERLSALLTDVAGR